VAASGVHGDEAVFKTVNLSRKVGWRERGAKLCVVSILLLRD